MHQTINNLKVSHIVDKDALSVVISQHKCDFIVSTQEIAWIIVFCMKTLKAGYLDIDW